MVCHCNCLPNDSFVPSLKTCMSSGKRRTCTKLWATRPPSPLSHTLTLADAGRGLPSSWKVGYHFAAAREVDVTFIPVWAVDCRMTIPPDGWGGVLMGASPKLAWVCSAVHCLFREQLEGGGGVLDLCLGTPAAVGLVGRWARNGQSS